MKDPAVVMSATRNTRRATGYLRWYPRVWRERYGDEFVAHLEAELEEHPMSATRSMNIALHGVTTRFKLQSSVRWISGVAVTLVLVTSLIVSVLVLESRWPGVPLSLETGQSMGAQVFPNVVSNLNFIFTNHSTKLIRITKVSLIGFGNYDVPNVVRVAFDPHRQTKYFLINPPSSTPGLVRAQGRLVRLGNHDSLVVSMRAPKEGHFYAVEGLRLTYVHAGVTHQVTFGLKGPPDLLCVVQSPSGNQSPECSRFIATADALAYLKYPNRHQTLAQNEAIIVTNAALSYVTAIGKRVSGIENVRQWATRIFAHRGTWRIVRVSATRMNENVAGVKPLLFHFELRKRTTGATTTVCVENGVRDSGGGQFAPALMACR